MIRTAGGRDKRYQTLFGGESMVLLFTVMRLGRGSSTPANVLFGEVETGC